jgi:uncharacterized protein YydD (DUF2326 family)
MIFEIGSSQLSFNTVKLSDGLNIIVAEKGKTATRNDSRNGLGKTTLIEVIHFCLGGGYDRNSRLSVSELEDWDFYIKIQIEDVVILARRYIKDNGKIFITILDGINPFEFKIDKETKEDYLTLEEWKKYLGSKMFDLPKDITSVSSRTLLGFFIRRDAGYTDAFKINRSEKIFTTLVNNAYVLGLDWSKAIELNTLRSESESIKIYKDSAAEALGDSEGVLKSKIVALEDDVSVIKKSISEFNVLPEYRSVQTEVNNITTEMHDLANKNMFLDIKEKAYLDATKEEKSPDNKSLEYLYKEANIVFSESVKLSIESAKVFHQEIIKNRKVFLENEIQFIKSEILRNQNLLESLSSQKKDKMRLLESHGALEEFAVIQENLIKKQELLERTKIKYDELLKSKEKIAELKSQIDAVKHSLVSEYRLNTQINENIKVFHENHKRIYGDDSGNLVISFNQKGDYKYSFDIEKGASSGKYHIAIFCYDLMLIENARKLNDWGIDFLVHDSILFDPVDERQVALAIELAVEKSHKYGFQYIMTINSDQLPVNDFSEGFDYKSLIRLQLRDESISKSLLGIKISNPSGEEE